MRRFVLAALAVLLVAGGVVGWNAIQSDNPAPKMQLAATSGCYGEGCNGLNPSGRCDDGRTVAAMHVKDGILELRFSKSCQANWGRYTPYKRTAALYVDMTPRITMFPLVTVWNPGSQSYGLAHAYPGYDNYGSSWSQMVDGTKTACTGVEVYTSSEGWRGTADNPKAPTGWKDKIWQWGPCR